MAKLTGAPFVKVEATKYTEVGFKGSGIFISFWPDLEMWNK